MPAMDQRYPTPLVGDDGSRSSTQSSSQEAARLRNNKLASIDTTSYTQRPVKAAEPSPVVRRKPVGSPAASASEFQRRPTLTTGGRVVAAGRSSEDNLHLDDIIPPRVPWQQAGGASPRRQTDGPQAVYSHDIPQSPGLVPFHELSADQAREVLLNLDTNPYSPTTLTHARGNSDPPRSPMTHRQRPSHQLNRSETMPTRADAPGPIQISVNDTYTHTYANNNGGPTPNKQGMSKFSSFFGWKGNTASSPIAESSPTTISDRSTPAQSPNGTSLSSWPVTGKAIPSAIDTSRANAPAHALFTSSSFPQAPPTPAMSYQLEEMEEELKDISAELAGSIRREMELEDQVERLQIDGPNALDKDKRTSDYYSESEHNSVQDPDASTGRVEDLEKVKRRSEQEKAQMKLDLSQKLQEERSRRRAMEEHVKSLEYHIQSLEQSGVSRRDSTGRVHELEVALEDNRRRLSEERKHKENYEDLLKALRSEMLQHKNERDNLRDEIVPALRAQVEGLEAEASEYQTLVYENARMQQELNALKMGRSPVGPIAEDGFTGRKMGLTRSSSVMRGTTTLSRSNSVSNKGPQESRESLADRVKDIEAQRDALHRALKSLLDRQRFQTREHEKRVKVLEQERDVALDASSPRRRGFEQEVGDLRYELNELRRRADEALEQKWQCEKGLGGLKKDLDRSEQETASLRTLLVVNEIVVPDNLPTEPLDASLANSATLEKAYRELREAQSQSITRLRELNGITPSASEDDKTVETMNKLLQTMSKAEAERDLAQKQAESFRAQAESLQDISFYHEGENENMAGQLHASAQRIDVLSSQVKRQLTQNSELRERLAIAIGTGEREQKVSSTRIAQLQERLRELEDKIMNAQQRSEDSVHSHEEDVREINIAKQSSHTRLHRLKTNGMGMRSPNSPLSPMIRSPRLDKTTSGQGKSMSEAAQTEALQAKVRELESALKEADLEMGEVVQRMTKAQMEVMELQSARDEADMKTRALQNQIRAENDAVGSLTRNMS